MPKPIKYGVHDGRAARYTDREAWVLVDGTWHENHPVFIRLTGAPLTKQAYRDAFGPTPPLPDSAFDPDRPLIRYGSLDGLATRFTCHEAWLLAKGTWREFDPVEAIHKAAVLSEPYFRRTFGPLPPLPAAAFPWGRTAERGWRSSLI